MKDESTTGRGVTAKEEEGGKTKTRLPSYVCASSMSQREKKLVRETESLEEKQRSFWRRLFGFALPFSKASFLEACVK